MIYKIARVWKFLYKYERHRMLCGIVLALTGLYASLTAWISKRIIDAIVTPAAVNIVPGIHNALFFAIVYGILTLLVGWMGSYSVIEMVSLKDRITSVTDQLLMNHAAASLDITQFESPATRDRIRLAAGGGRAVPALFSESIEVLQQLITVGGLSLILAYYHPLLVAIVFIPSIPFFYSQMRVRAHTFAAMVHKSPEYRRMGYFVGLMLGIAPAKEIRTYQSGNFFLTKYQEVADHIFEFARTRRWEATLATIVWGCVAAAGIGGAYIYIIFLATKKTITVGDVVMYSGAVFYAGIAVRGLIQSTSSLWNRAREAEGFFDYIESSEGLVSGSCVGTLLPSPDFDEWVFDHVSFSYPGRASKALDNISFRIRAKEKIAIVGFNGAGKTTLLKLMLRFMDPDQGQIKFRGIGLKDWDIASLRENFGAVFQDFAHFKLSLYENIALGRKEGRSDVEHEAVFRAAQLAGVDEFAKTAPLGYHTCLSREFQGGIDLSGGQWQQVALARGFARDSEVVLLDEPNASLDAKGEEAMFAKVLALSEDKTAVIISHRLLITPMVDRVLVIENGRLVEEGSHNELMGRDGQYAKMYKTQAGMYWPQTI